MQQIATALFANSPFVEGKPSGYLSMRRFLKFFLLLLSYSSVCFPLSSIIDSFFRQAALFY